MSNSWSFNLACEGGFANRDPNLDFQVANRDPNLDFQVANRGLTWISRLLSPLSDEHENENEL